MVIWVIIARMEGGGGIGGTEDETILRGGEIKKNGKFLFFFTDKQWFIEDTINYAARVIFLKRHSSSKDVSI